jgi:hypothetical protein
MSVVPAMWIDVSLAVAHCAAVDALRCHVAFDE